MPLLEDEQDIVVGGSENEDSASENSQNEDEDSEEEEEDGARAIINSRPRRNLNFDDIDFDNMVNTLIYISLKKVRCVFIILIRKLMKLVQFLVSK